MTRFQTILARLCASSGRTLLHVDSPAGAALRETIGDELHGMLEEALGEEGAATLAQDQEVQVIMAGTPPDAESTGHIQMMRVIKALVGVDGSSAMLVTGSGKVSRWEQGSPPRIEALDDDALAEAIASRRANAAA